METTLNPAGAPAAPTAPNPLAEAEAATRRSLLRFAFAATAVPAAGSLAAGTAEAANPGQLPTIYPGWVKRNFAEIRNNERSHLQIVQTAIVSLGGTPRPKPVFQNLVAANQTQFAQMSANFENLGAAAYFAGGPFFANPNAAAVANSLGLVEAYQGGFLNTLLNGPVVPRASTYQLPATPEQATSAASPYIASLNDNGLFPPTYAPVRSPENDIAIFNFALILEYLENEFYALNLPRLFNI